MQSFVHTGDRRQHVRDLQVEKAPERYPRGTPWFDKHNADWVRVQI